MSDFVIEITGGHGDYQLKVDSPAGEAHRTTLGVEVNPERMMALQSHVLASASSRRAATSEMEREVRTMGAELFRALFEGPASSLYFASRQHAEKAGESLRMVLRIDAPELAHLPWELLFDEAFGGYLGLREPLVRYVELLEPVTPLTVAPPLRILGMTALPEGVASLDAATEQRNLEASLRPLIDEGLVQLAWVEGQTWDHLQDRLIDGCHVFHFIGHGGFDPARAEGLVAFADEAGGVQRMYATSLARLLSTARPSPRLVVLNTCQSGTASSRDLFSSTASILVRTVPAVVAMQFEITDGAAKVFSRALYQAIARNRPVDEAVRIARIAVSSAKDETLEWATPVLYLRSTDGRLFDLGGAKPAEGETVQQLRVAATGAYWSGQWEEAIQLLGALRARVPGDSEIEDMFRLARLGLRYQQGREADGSGDWEAAAAHYQAVAEADPSYEDATIRLDEARRQAEIGRLKKQMQEMSAAGHHEAVIRIGDRLVQLAPEFADQDDLVAEARQHLSGTGLSGAAPIGQAPPIEKDQGEARPSIESPGTGDRLTEPARQPSIDRSRLRQRLAIVAVAAVVVLSSVAVWRLLPDDPDPPVTTQPAPLPATTASPPRRTSTSPAVETTVTVASIATTVPVPPPSALQTGLFCMHLAENGHTFANAVGYWIREGTPDRMDEDLDGIPCETRYPAEEVAQFLSLAAHLPGGLFCRDVRNQGGDFVVAVAYWLSEQMPDRMDEDLNGIPCETIYDEPEVARFLLFDSA